MHILEIGDFEQKWSITKVLVKYGEKVVSPLKQVILNPQAHLEHRCFAIRILSQIKNPQIVLIMTELLINTDQEELITLATQTLAVQGKDSIAFLSQLLDDENYRLLACKALAQIPHRSVIEPLLSVVTDSDHQVRKIALMALRNFSEPKITQILIMALQDYNSDIRKEALIGLRLRLKANQAIPLIAILMCILDVYPI